MPGNFVKGLNKVHKEGMTTKHLKELEKASGMPLDQVLTHIGKTNHAISKKEKLQIEQSNRLAKL